MQAADRIKPSRDVRRADEAVAKGCPGYSAEGPEGLISRDH